jgi:separase
MILSEQHHLASQELDWLHDEILQKYPTSRAGRSFEYAIPNTLISARLCDLILELQALSLTCALFQTPTSQITDLLLAVTRHPAGPMSWQHYVRSTAKAEGTETADRHAYSIERSMTKYLAKYAKAPNGIDADVVLQCRKISLDFLLFVSDLDQDAFWDRTARVASSYMRSKSTSESTSSQDKRAAFLVADDVLRDVVRRAEQIQLDLSGSSDNRKLQGKGFSSFCEAWIQLAQRAGEAQAIHYVAGLLAADDDVVQGVQILSEGQIDSLVTQLCARLSQSVVAIGDMLEGEVEMNAFRTAEVEVDAGLRLANLASSDGLQRLFKVIDQLRRRIMRLLDDKKVKAEDVTTLLLAICKHYEQYLESDGKAQLEDDEAMLDDCIYVLRSLANSAFILSDLKTHEAAASYLSRCDTLLNLRQGKMERIGDAVRCNKMRLLSSSWYYIGGQLYNDKKLPLAIRFLKVACETAQTSLVLYNSLAEKTDSKGEIVKRPEGTAKKWEHLAVSYRHISQSRLSYEAFVNALQCTEEKTWKNIADRASKKAISAVFDTSTGDSSNEKSVGDVASVARSCFELAAFDLLLYQNESEVKDWTQILLQNEHARDSIPALLEHCLVSLDNLMHREEAPKAALCTINELLSLYASVETPLRRARILIRKMELNAMQPHLFQQEGDGIASTVKEIESLLNQKELSKDVNLAQYIPQHLMMLSLLQILHEKEPVTPSAHNNVLRYAEEANGRLKKIVSGTSLSTNRALKTSNAPRQQSADTLPVTPPRAKGGKRTIRAPIRAVEAVDSVPVLDDAQRQLSIIELVVEVLRSRGHYFGSIALLKLNSKLAEALSDYLGPNYYLQYSASLIRQYLSLELTVKAGRLVAEVKEAMQKEQKISEDTRVRCLLANAEYHCRIGELGKSEECYYAAVGIASSIEAEGRMNSLQSGLHRCLTHERQALAAETISSIQFAKGDLVFAIKYAVLGVRSAMKAGLVLSRLTTSGDSKGDEASPFVQGEREKDQAAVEEAQVAKASPAPQLKSTSVAIVYWRMIRTLYAAYMKVANLYKIRGSARDAEGFMGEAIDFGSSVYIPRLLASALIERGAIRNQMGITEKGQLDLTQAAGLMDEDGDSWEALNMAVAKAEVVVKASSLEVALEQYDRALNILDIMSVQYNRLEKEPAPSMVRKGSSVKSRVKTEPLLPTTRGMLLQKRAWLLTLLEREEEGREALDQAAILLQNKADKDIQSCYQGKIQVHQSMRVLRADPVMGMLPESVISMPMAKLGSKCRNNQGGAIKKAAISRLEVAQTLLEGVLESDERSCINSIALHDAYTSTVTSHILSSVLQGHQAKAAKDVISLQQSVNAITLQRELQEAIETKLERKAAVMSLPGWQLPSKEHTNQQREDLSGESSEDEARDDVSLDARWSSISKRHREVVAKVDLPENWTVISITLHRERNCLVLTRLFGTSSALVFSLPIDRQSRREGEEDAIGVDVVLEELKSIIEHSNTATHSAQHLEGLQARKEWWTTRRELDNRMKELLASIEVSWLGAFKSLLLPRPKVSEEDAATLRSSLDAMFQRALFSASNGSRNASQVGIDDDILDCFSSLSATTCTDEELEDLLHFVMDAYQFHGMPVAVDEIDMDLCVTELRGILEAYRAKHQVEESENDRHVFLILDKDTCAIPWESIPLLRKQAVCRIPSLAFLQDRLEQSREQGTPGRFTIKAERAKVWYLLNPSKDLTRTQDRFLPWLEKQPKWKGIVNRAPIIEEMAEALESNDVVLYFGHGGGEQYIRPSRLRSLKKCAVTMLWGCSSGVLKDLGDFDRSGTPYNYLMAGCPSLLGNLWDATDKELDGISESVLEKMGLKQEKDNLSGNLSIAQAVAQSRDACKLPYLTGAACVVYGIPVYYQ